MKLSSTDIWAQVHAERARLVDDLTGLPPTAWTTPSLCPGWDVHDVLAHLVDTAHTTRRGFAWRMITTGFAFDRDNQHGVDRHRQADPRDTLAAMRAAATLTLTPIAPRATRLVEAVVHGEDIRRPLGIAGVYHPQALHAALAHQVATGAALGGGRERVEGLRLVATDLDLGWGAGPELRGRAVDLLLAVSGRPVGAAALHGPGANRLARSL